MSVKVENIEKNKVKLEIEVEAKKFEECLNKAFNRNKSRFNIPGFRKGKAPRNVVERYYGEQILYEDAINYACADAYEDAVSDNEIKPVDKPELDIVQIGSGQNFIFTATVTVAPEVELGDYKGLKVEKEEAVVTDEDVDKELQKEVEKRARLVAVEDRPIEDGDTLNIDFLGSVDGVPFEGGEGKDYTLVVGSGTFIPGFEEQLIGANLDDHVDVNVTFPEEYHSEELKGKAALFKVKINDIKVKELPEVNDDFASEASEFETLDEYKAHIKVKLTEQAQQAADRKYEEDLVKKAVDNASCEIPEVMVDKRLDQMLNQFDMQLRYQGMSLEQYLQMMGMDISKFKADYYDNALNDEKTQLVLEKIAEVENIIASEEEYEAELEEMAKKYNQTADEMKKQLRDEDIEYIKDSIEQKKTIELLVKNAK